ncbi:MAG: polysaccharide biosynthesis C-terminal domain-containing protein [Actinobacteria bacterium]|nr:polysaccharide biosynthesis C-terminal domain-containing protein [Actinomycetota bacterium]
MEVKSYQKVAEGIRQIMSLSFIVAIFVILFGNYIGYVLSSQSYHNALQYIPILTVGMYFSFGYQLYARGINYSKKTLYLAITFTLAGGVNIGLNYQLIPLFGITGAAIATLCANIVLMLGGYVVNKFILKYPDSVILPFIKTLMVIIIALCIKYYFDHLAYLDFFIAFFTFMIISFYVVYIYRKILMPILQKKG